MGLHTLGFASSATQARPSGSLQGCVDADGSLSADSKKRHAKSTLNLKYLRQRRLILVGKPEVLREAFRELHRRDLKQGGSGLLAVALLYL